MNSAASPERPDPADAAVAEYFEAMDRGESVDLQEFLKKYPDVGNELEQFFDASELVKAMAGPTLADRSRLSQSADTSRIAGLGETISTANRISPQLTEGSEFGRYRIESKVGQGAMGAVFSAYDTQLARKVALKIPVFDESEEPEMIQRFYREAQAAATLRSPHICPVFDVDKIDGIHFIAMAYIEGQSLSQWIRAERQRTNREIAAIVRKLAIALQKAHDSGVIHRDLKPGNVMLDRDGEPVVMDFGLARLADTKVRDTKAGTLLGSPAYMSPEQIKGELDAIGPTADVYSLGVILYEMLTGELPYRGTVVSVIGQLVTSGEPPTADCKEGVDAGLAAICRKMMAKPIEQRYASMTDVAAALQRFLEGQTIEEDIVPAELAAPTDNSLFKQPHESSPRRKSLRWGLLGLALAGMGALAFFFWIPRERANDELQATTESPTKPAPMKDEQKAANPAPLPKPAEAALRYGFQQGKTYRYAVEVEAVRGHVRKSTERLTGTLTYMAIKVDTDGEASLRVNSSFRSSVSSEFGSPHFMEHRGTFPPLKDSAGDLRNRQLIIDDRGRIVASAGEAALPFGLGELPLLLIEQLPEKYEKTWKTREDVVLNLKPDPFSPRSSMLPSRHRADRSISNTTNQYEVVSSDDRRAVIKKSFRVSPSNRSMRLLMISGTSQIQFDRKRGLITQVDGEVRIMDSTVQPLAISLRCRLLAADQPNR